MTPPAEVSTVCEELLDRFEQAWRDTPPADLDAHLPAPGQPARWPALVALVHTDLEYRLKAGQPARVEDYLARYPELVGDGAALLDLLAWEFEMRRRNEPALSLADYRARFPDHSAALAERLATLTTLSALPTGSPAGHGGASPCAPPGYEVLGEIGRGGMGVVFKARQVALDRIVALKWLRGNLAEYPAARARFQLEAQAVARLDHPGIVRIHDSGLHQGQPYFAMEFVAGGCLADRADAFRSPRAAAALVAHLADAVEYAHQQGIVHRDLKPSNVLLAAGGLAGGAKPPAADLVPKITDFGLARYLGIARQTLPGEFVGSPAYMAPEQASGSIREPGPTTDVFGLGAILYELLTGRPPFQGEQREAVLAQARAGRITPPRQINPRAPRALEHICRKALSANPAARHPSAAALAEELRRYLRRPQRVLAAGLLIALVAASLGGGLLYQQMQKAPVVSGEPPVVVREEKPLSGTFRVLVSTNGLKGWLRLPHDWARALPVPNGEGIRLVVELNQPGYVYLVYIDSEGKVIPLYPWNDNESGDLEVDSLTVPPPPRRAQVWVASPRRYPRGWEIVGPSGLETVMLLARRTPLPADPPLHQLIPRQQPAPMREPFEQVERVLQHGQAIRELDRDENRGLGPKAREIDEPLARLMGRLAGHFELIHAIRFAHKGD
jgi:serine/threonine protein kinase